VTLPPSTRRVLVHHLGYDVEVYLCGTAHISSQSCTEVSELIRAVRPKIILVELCTQRLSMLKASTEGKNPEAKNITLRSSISAFRRGEASALEALFMWIQASSARMLSVSPGEEFRVAYAEAKALNSGVRADDTPSANNGNKHVIDGMPLKTDEYAMHSAELESIVEPNRRQVCHTHQKQCHFLLADRPCQITLRRIYECLTNWQRARLLVAVICSSIFTTPARLKRWLDKQLSDSDQISEEILRLGKSFPQLIRTLINERDDYMVARFMESCTLLVPPSSSLPKLPVDATPNTISGENNDGPGSSNDPMTAARDSQINSSQKDKTLLGPVVFVVGAGHVNGMEQRLLLLKSQQQQGDHRLEESTRPPSSWGETAETVAAGEVVDGQSGGVVKSFPSDPQLDSSDLPPFDHEYLAALSRSKSGQEVYSAVPVSVSDDMVEFLHANPEDAVRHFYEVKKEPKEVTDNRWTYDGNGGFGMHGGGLPPLRFREGARVLVRDPEGLVIRGKVVRQWYDAGPEYASERQAAGDVDQKALPTSQSPSLVAYLVLSDLGDYLAAPIDSECCISSDDFWNAAAQAAYANAVATPAAMSLAF